MLSHEDGGAISNRFLQLQDGAGCEVLRRSGRNRFVKRGFRADWFLDWQIVAPGWDERL
jgi:hypothetical protein